IADKLTTDDIIEVTATSTSELEVVLTVTGPATIEGTTITLEGVAGTVTVAANQSGNEEFEAAEEVSITFEVTEPIVSAIDPTPISIKVYPNPATDWIAVEGIRSGMARLQVINLDGHMVLDQQVQASDRIDVTQLSEGMYLLQTTQENITTTTKVLIH
ncbi:T9SS type A sorting domain-containing protein, partial [Reichenbachiella sp.]